MQLPGLCIGIIADDLTGACDTALQFFHSKASNRPATTVLLDYKALPQENPKTEDCDNHVWSINTASRHIDPLEAQALVRRVVTTFRDNFGVVNFYKKIDSTLRGNIAHECLGMLDELKAQCAVIVPAFPQEGRRTVGGYQLVRGIPVERTLIARDPLYPVRISHIPTLLTEATTPDIVGHIQLSTVLHGAGPVLVKLNELIKDGKKLVVIDAATQEDLEQIALATEKAQKTARILPCGSGGFAQALTRFWQGAQEENGTTPAAVIIPLQFTAPEPTLIVSGSNTEMTRHQIHQLREHYAYYGQGTALEVFALGPDLILGRTSMDETVQKILDAMGERNTVLVSTAIKEEDYARTIQQAREADLTEAQAARMAQELLAHITREILKIRSAKLILTGGEVTQEVCQAIGSKRLEIVDEVDRSIPLNRDEHGRWIITKSGGFGTPMALANIVKYLKQRESATIHA